jgi:glycosyltransferase involved in cell wall biosynthesis
VTPLRDESPGASAKPDDDARLRIAFVLATSTGGVGRHVAAAARGVSGAGHAVAVLGPPATDRTFHFSGAGDKDARTNAAAANPNVRFRAVEIAGGVRPLVAWRAALRLRALTRGADVVHAHGFRAGVVCAIALSRWRAAARVVDPAGVRRRPALVVTLHNAMLGRRSRRWVLNHAMRRLARVADGVLAVSADLVAELAPGGRAVDRALVAAQLPSPAHDVASTRAALGISGAVPMMLAVGRLHPQKGFDVLVDAARLLRDRGVRAATVIAGDGPARADLQRAIDAAGVDVRLLGNRSDVAELLAAADVVVMPSRWEGWPLAAVEVLEAGKPLVATKVGGLPELVDDAGVLVEACDAAALATAMATVLDDADFAADLAHRARRRAHELPSDADVTAQLLDCYRCVTGSRA